MADDDRGLTPDAQALLDAVTAMGSDLDLHNVLERIVVAACQMTGARYGALGVIGEGDTLSDFITHGIDATAREAIGELPHGRGILGLLIHHPKPLRLTDLQHHAASYGFPANHPQMTTFLGVPVLIRDTMFGNLYLTEKSGGVPFTAHDEQLVEALARAAGIAIENARAYFLSERQRAWLETAARLNDALKPGVEVADALQLVAIATRRVSRALAVGVLHVEDGESTVVAADGRDIDALSGLAVQLRDDVALAAAGEHPAPVPLDRNHLALVLPLRAHLFGAGVMLVLLDRSAEHSGLGHKEQDLVASFADQAALALDRVQALEDREQLAVVSDRDRIARDLHDLVIQRLFATGLQLQGVLGQVASQGVATRLQAAVAELDTTIRDIRSTIFALQQPQPASVRAAVQGLVREYTEVLGFSPSLVLHGPVDTMVAPRLAEHLLAVLREGLSNVMRHAQATELRIELAVDTAEMVLTVRDNGVGLPEGRNESGLRNVRRRAAELDGAVRVSGESPSGTVLEWRVPLSSSKRGAQSVDGTTATGDPA